MKLGLGSTLLALMLLTGGCTQRVEMSSVHTPSEKRYTSERKSIVLRPGKTSISVPSNELWAIHTNPVSRGWPQNEPFIGKAWDRAEIRFVLLPTIQKRTSETEASFNEAEGRKLLRIVLMQPMGADGDTRTAWKTVRLEPIEGVSPAVYDAAKAAGAYPAPLVARRPEMNLDEYEGKDDYGSQFFKSESTIIRCWRPPLSEIRHVCGSSFNLANGLLVNVEFHFESLPQWKELLAFSMARAADYASR